MILPRSNSDVQSLKIMLQLAQKGHSMTCDLKGQISRLLAGISGKKANFSKAVAHAWSNRRTEFGGTIMENAVKKPLPESRTYTVEDVAAMLNIGRTSAYMLVKEGHFKMVRIGNAIRISRKSFDAWLESLDL